MPQINLQFWRTGENLFQKSCLDPVFSKSKKAHRCMRIILRITEESFTSHIVGETPARPSECLRNTSAY